MSEPSSNPYASPNVPAERRTWREWLRHAFITPRPQMSPDEAFALGVRWMLYGVVFRLDPQDATSVRASLPLAVQDDVHVRRNVNEAIRVLCQMLQHWPQLNPTVRGRTLVVSMVDSYKRDATELLSISVPAREWELPLNEAAAPPE